MGMGLLCDQLPEVFLYLPDGQFSPLSQAVLRLQRDVDGCTNIVDLQQHAQEIKL